MQWPQGGPNSGQGRPSAQGFAGRPFAGGMAPNWQAGASQQQGIPGVSAPGQGPSPSWGQQANPGAPRMPFPGPRGPGAMGAQPRMPLPQPPRKDAYPPGIQPGYGLPGAPRPGMGLHQGPQSTQQMQQQVVRQAQAQAQARAQAALGGQAQPQAYPGAPGAGQGGQTPLGGPGGMQQPRPMDTPGRSPVGAATPGAQTPGSSGWTEHTAPDGRKYFYNAATKVSSWTRPPELNPPPQEGTAESSPVVKPQEVQCAWKEFSAPDGRKYYYNRTTKESKWQMPEELKQANALAASQKAQKATPTGVQVVKLESPAPSPAIHQSPVPITQNGTAPLASFVKAEEAKAELPEPKKPVVYATKEEAKDAFKELLASVNTSSHASWESTMRLIVNDPRYAAFKTIGERKSCFNEYLQQRANEEKDEKRRKEKQTREDFFTLLELSPELRTGMRYSKAAALFEDEPRWKAIKDSRERETLFLDHMKERERKEKEEKRQEIKRRKAAFKALLESNKSIKVDLPWRKAQTKVEGEEEYEALDKFERLDVYQDHIRDLEKKEKELKEKEKEDRRRQERKHRELFKDMLKKHLEDGFITPRMRWKEYFPLVEEEDVLKAVERNLQGSRPKELFDDVLEEIEDKYLKDREILRAVKTFEIKTDSIMEDYMAALDASEEPHLQDISYAFRKAFFEEELGKVQARQAKEEKHRLRLRDDFISLLKSVRRIKYDTPWTEASGQLEKEPEFKALNEAEREELYNSWIEKLQAKREKDKEREKEEKRSRKDDDKPRKDKKKHKKERHGDKEKAADRKSKDKPSSKRRHSDSEVEGEPEKKAKRSRKEREESAEREDGKGGASAEAAAEELPGPPPAPRPRPENGSDDEEGQL